jgi:hypothetical protein
MAASRFRTYVGVLGALALMFATASPVAANDTNGGIFVHAIDLRPRNGAAEGIGAGIEAALVPWKGTRYMDCPSGCIQGPYQPVYFGVGAFATHSTGTDADTRRDLYGLSVSIGLGKGPTDWFIPFCDVGLDARVVNTISADSVSADGVHHLGPTIGADVRVGVLGLVGDRLMYAVSASYLGAVAPGTGDNAGGLLLQASIGWRFWPGR